MIRIAIADDHAIVRQGLKQIVAAEPDLEVTVEAANGQELLDMIRTKDVDVVLLDIAMPGRSGLDVLKDLKRERPALPVLVFTMHAEERFGLRALRGGAAGYLTKDNATTELVKAIRKVVSGGKYIGPSLAEQLATDLGAGYDKPPHHYLSDREFQVLRLLASGKTASEIADTLSISVKTVSTYRTRILEKLRLTTTAALIRYALHHRLVD